MSYQSYNEKVIASPDDDEITIMSLLRTNLQTGRHFILPLMNVYKGIPISNRSELIDINEKYVWFKTNPLQMAAIQAASETVIRFPASDTETVIGKLDHLDVIRNIVTLKEFTFADFHVDKRAAVRLQLLPPLNVDLHVNGNKISASVRDISIDGINITTTAVLGPILEHANSIKFHLKFLHNNVIKQAEIPVHILRVNKKSPFNCVLLFEHTFETENTLSLFLNQRQIEIIRELKELVKHAC